MLTTAAGISHFFHFSSIDAAGGGAGGGAAEDLGGTGVSAVGAPLDVLAAAAAGGGTTGATVAVAGWGVVAAVLVLGIVALLWGAVG